MVNNFTNVNKMNLNIYGLEIYNTGLGQAQKCGGVKYASLL